MTPRELIEAFETLADAPDGVKRLRELVLQLAVRGKLVPQDPADEPADTLLSTLASDRGITAIRSQPEREREMPNGWRMVPFGRTHINRDAERIPLSREERSLRQGKYDYYGASGIIDSVDDYLFDKPLLLIGEDGANLVLRSTPIAYMARGRYWVNNHAHVLDSTSEQSLRYLAIFINSINLESYLTGTAQPKLNQAKLNSIPCPFPPLAEQQRIVARVDELMGLLDRLEAARAVRDEVRRAARDAALAALRDAEDTEAVEIAWARISGQMDALFNTPEDVRSLRSAILQLAVRGRLVPQADETGSQSSIKTGTQQECAPSAPFCLPETWSWSFLRDIAVQIQYGYTASALQQREGVRLLRITDIQNNSVDWASVPGCDIRPEDALKFKLKDGDIVVARTGGTVGKSFLVYGLGALESVFASYLIRITPGPTVTATFLKRVLESPHYWEHIIDRKAGTGQPNVNATALGELLVPVPHTSEQRHIVARIDVFMGLCDALETQLTVAQAVQARFAAAAVHHLDV